MLAERESAPKCVASIFYTGKKFRYVTVFMNMGLPTIMGRVGGSTASRQIQTPEDFDDSLELIWKWLCSRLKIAESNHTTLMRYLIRNELRIKYLELYLLQTAKPKVNPTY